MFDFDVVVSSAANNGNSTVLRFDGETGEFEGEYASGVTVTDPRDILPFPSDGPPDTIVLNNGDDRILTFDAQTGEFLSEFAFLEGLNPGGGNLWTKWELFRRSARFRCHC